MKPVTNRRSWNPWHLLICFITLGLGLSLAKGQSNPPPSSNSELEPEVQLNYGPIFSVPHALTGSLVSDSEEVPEGYISSDGNDIGSEAENNDWTKYLATQNGLKLLIPLLLLLFLAVPILGLLYACFCVRCNKAKRSSKQMRYCCGTLLAIAALLMLLFLIFAILAATQLNKSLKKSGYCQLQQKSSEPQSTSEQRRRLYVENYKQLLRRIEGAFDSDPNITQSHIEGEVHAQAIEKLSQVLRDIHRVKPLLEELKEELPKASRLAIRFRDVLSGVKGNLKAFLTSQCTQGECQDFYRINEIRLLDRGCVQYDGLPAIEDLTKSIQKVLGSNFITYPRLAAQQLRQISKAIKERIGNLLATIKRDLHKGAQQLQERYKASSVQRQRARNGTQEEEKEQRDRPQPSHPPASALRRKLGRSWFRITLGTLVLFMLLPILLLIGLLVALSSPNVASWLFCGALVGLFLLFSLALVLVLFFLVHGALTYQGFCAGQHPQLESDKSTDLPRNDSRTRSLPELQDGDGLRQRVLDALRDEVKKDVHESMEKTESASLPSNLSTIYTQAAAAARELLIGQLSTYNSSHFTRHMCLELVPEPKPGPLPGLITRLDNLTESVGWEPLLVNQTINLRAAHKQLGQPLAAILQRLRDLLRQLDHILSGGYGSFTKYMSLLLAKIKQGDQYLSRDAKKVTDEVARNISDFVDSGLDKYVRMVDDSTKGTMESLAPLTRQEIRLMREYNDLCSGIAKPMNAVWFWLLLFALMLLPAICCSHYLRCFLRRPRNHSQETLVSLGEENFVVASLLPVELPRCHCYKYLPVAPETNVDQLEARNDYYVDQEEVSKRYPYEYK